MIIDFYCNHPFWGNYHSSNHLFSPPYFVHFVTHGVIQNYFATPVFRAKLYTDFYLPSFKYSTTMSPQSPEFPFCIFYIYGSKFYYTTFLTSQCPKISNTLGILKIFPKTKSFFSPCSHKIYPLSTNLKQSSALRTFSMGVYQTPEIGCFLLFSKI